MDHKHAVYFLLLPILLFPLLKIEIKGLNNIPTKDQLF